MVEIMVGLRCPLQLWLCTHVDTPDAVPGAAHDAGPAGPTDAAPGDQSDTAPAGPSDAATGDRSIGVRDLRAGLAEAVRRAGAGERTVITSGGRPVAQLAPLDAGAPDLERLIGAGAVIPPRRTSEWRPPEPVPVWAGVRVDQVLRELRG